MPAKRAEIRAVTAILYRMLSGQRGREEKRFRSRRRRRLIMPDTEIQIVPYTEVFRMDIW